MVKTCQGVALKMQKTDKTQIANAYETLRGEQPWKHESSNILHQRVIPFATLAPWLNNTDFMEIHEKIRECTLVDLYRCYELWNLAKQSIKVEGVILEVGVWRGGTGAILAEATKSNNKKVFLADTFNGVVKAGTNDTIYKGGEHADTSLSLVSQLMSSLTLSNVELLEGVFPEDTHHMVEGNISMLHCDVDVYSSCRDIVKWCLPRMLVGAILVFDDYGFYGCEGVTIFCDELKHRNDLIFTHNLNGHAVFVKIS
jgi:O-methyltransferase